MLDVLTGTGAVAAPVLSYFGQQQTNRSNETSAKDAMRFSQAQTKEQMKWQERMSNTAVQRSREDHRKAGLNPLLALQNQASTPLGGAASGEKSIAENALGQGVASAMEGAMMHLSQRKGKEEISNLQAGKKLTDAQEKKTKMETEVLRKGLPEAEVKNEIMDAIRPYIKKMKQGSSTSAIGDYLGEKFQDKPSDMKTFKLNHIEKNPAKGGYKQMRKP